MPQLSHPDQLSCNWNHGWETFRVTHSSPFLHLSTPQCSLDATVNMHLRNCCKLIFQRKKLYVFEEEMIY